MLCIAAAILGCGEGGPQTHAVAGRINLQGGDIAKLAGSTLEIASTSDNTVRGFGEIQPDGRFRIQSLQAGQLRSGVLAGNYTARIIPNDEDNNSRKLATQAIARRYLQFETSKLTVQVPSSGELSLNIAAR
jgi:hypothetical protein